MQHIAFLSIGSNLGDRSKNLLAAMDFIEKNEQIHIQAISNFYETEPLTLKAKAQTWYVNACLKIKTSLSPVQLLRFLQSIEVALGRIRSEKWEPRLIDLDILFFDDLIIKSNDLTLPHPELTKRRFVLEPLCDIAADCIHPIKGLTIQSLAKSLKDHKKVVPLYRLQISRHNHALKKISPKRKPLK